MDQPLPSSASTTARPVRTCVGCRERSPRTELIRVVAVSDGVTAMLTPDLRGSAHGRGAHLHPDVMCLELARRRKAFGRALRVEGPIDDSRLSAHVRSLDAGPVPPARHDQTSPSPDGGTEQKRSTPS
ncbi:MAG: YlxR family protein [Nocardioidaceae bacterium]